MSNLFSSFDPQSLFNIPLNWASSFLVILILPPVFWVSKSQVNLLFLKTSKTLWTEFYSILNHSSIPGVLLPSLSLLTFVLLNNFMGLFPYVFTASSHLTFTISMALPLWIGHMLMAWAKTPNSMLAHLVPMGTPNALMPFMVVIELVSSLIRPLTLSVRLAANMIAGHLLLTLLASQASVTMLSLASLAVSGLIVLGMLECAVSLIQAYVFSILSSLYLNEVNSPSIS